MGWVVGWCVVVGCKKNTFKEDRDRDVTFFPIPKDEKLRKVWPNPPKKPSDISSTLKNHTLNVI